MHQDNFKLGLSLLFLVFNVLSFSKDKAKKLIPIRTSSSTELSYHDTLSYPFNSLNKTINAINIGAKNPRFNGSILVGYQGKIIFEKSYGFADRAAGIKNDLDTPTQIASITKTFTGASIVWLVQNGFFKLDDQVQSVLPEFPYFGITIRQLLSHQSGLQEYMKFSKRYWTSSAPMSNQDVLNQLQSKNLRLIYKPGAKYDYTNTNYAILALIVERISGISFHDFIARYITEPLHMDKSFVYNPNKDSPMYYAKSYKANFRPWLNNYQDGVYGDKGIYTTPRDLYKWDQALYSDSLLNAESKRQAYQPTQKGDVSKNYGLGWRVKTYKNGNSYVYHTGWWHGYQGIFSRYIQDDFTIIITSNRFISGISKNAEHIYDACLPLLQLTDLEGKYTTKEDKEIAYIQ